MSDKPLGFVIEDDVDLAIIFSKALSSAGCEVELIHDGQVALDKLQTAVPRIIILDLNLPNVDGEKILYAIRHSPELEKAIVIVATANGTWSEMLTAKPNIVLEKPISFIQLSRICQRIVAADFVMDL